MKTTQFIGGQWSATAETQAVTNPYSGDVIAEIAKGTPDSVNEAVAAAKEAFPSYAALPAYQRFEFLNKTAALIRQHQEELTKLIAQEAGKSLKSASVEIMRSAQTFQFSAEEAKRLHGETVPLDAAMGSEGRFGFFLRQPVGVIGTITAFNFPLNLVAHKVGPALAAGNTVVHKPAPQTPLTSLYLAELMEEAGVPEGVFNVVLGDADVGQALVQHSDVAMIAFTGSDKVGEIIQSQAGLKKLLMELGDNSAVIIDEDANLERALPASVMGAFAYAGQVCLQAQRFYVHENIADKFIPAFVQGAGRPKLGDPLDPETDIGPMIDEASAIRAEQWLEAAVANGAEVLCGGKRNGSFFEPTILTNVKQDDKILCNEVFAPIVTVTKVKDLQQAVDHVNASAYGLACGLFTNNIDRAFAAIKHLQTGNVFINDSSVYRTDHMPFGGVKRSGYGREGVRYAMEEMTTVKNVVLNLDQEQQAMIGKSVL